MTDEFIHDPEGIILFKEPTELEVTSSVASSTETARALPFSARRGDRLFWAGADTYRLPADADYTVLEDLNLSEEDLDTEDDESLSLTALVEETATA